MAKKPAPATHSHTDAPGNVTAHLRVHAPGTNVDALPNGTARRHAMHERLHGGDISKPARPVTMNGLMRSAAKK